MWAVLGLLLVAWFGLQLAPAHAATGDVEVMEVDASVDRDGALSVEQTMTFEGAPPAELTQRIATVENSVGDAQYRYEISEVTASADGQPLPVAVDDTGEAMVVTIPTEGVAGPVTLSYAVDGAVRTTPDGTMLHWRFLQGLSAPVDDVTVEVGVPGLFSYIDCASGPPNSPTKCVTSSGGTEETSQTPTFTDGPRAANEVVSIEIGFPAGLVSANENLEYRWSLARGFSAEPLPLGLATGLLLLGAIVVWVLHRRAGADLSAGERVERVAEFTPVADGAVDFTVTSDIRPGEVGTMADERVDPVDVLATVLDLAVRGHLRITELPHRSNYAPADWQLERREADTAELQAYERRLLDAVGPVGGEPTRVSQMNEKIADAIPQVQSELYDEMVGHGWYDQRPDSTRNKWQRAAVIGLVLSVALTAVLAIFTTFGMIGLALVIICLGLMFVAQEMPARTAKGAAALRGLGLLSDELHSRSTTELPKGKELEVISRVLPYAVVLGGANRWLDAMVAADDDEGVADSTDLDWFHGPEDWHLADLPDSLRHLLLTLAGVLFTRT
ncbi:DUF2207 domain-containing protein [Naumannella halotolerans]|uniref:DUF2207 domain-containing protein n=1 Tax=Naumannella halotolerans TaxID=993414 RepID=UPI00370D3101